MGKTSWQVKDKYNRRTYTKLTPQIPRDLYEKFDAKCKAEGISMTEVIKRGMEKFIENKGD